MWQNDESNLPRISKQKRPTALYNVPSRYTRIFVLPVLLPHPPGACGFAETRETEGTSSVASWSEVVACDKVPGTPLPHPHLIME